MSSYNETVDAETPQALRMIKNVQYILRYDFKWTALLLIYLFKFCTIQWYSTLNGIFYDSIAQILLAFSTLQKP